MGPMGFMGPGGRFCSGNGAEMADHLLVRIEHKVKPTEAQKPAFEELKSAVKAAAGKVQQACPAQPAQAPGDPPAAPVSPLERLADAETLTAATLEAIKTVRPAAEKFYATLDDGQKKKLSERWSHWRDGRWGRYRGHGPDGGPSDDKPGEGQRSE
jgi:hypothetical protein